MAGEAGRDRPASPRTSVPLMATVFVLITALSAGLTYLVRPGEDSGTAGAAPEPSSAVEVPTTTGQLAGASPTPSTTILLEAPATPSTIAPTVAPVATVATRVLPPGSTSAPSAPPALGTLAPAVSETVPAPTATPPLGVLAGFDGRTVEVPAMCGHQAGRLVDGELPSESLERFDEEASSLGLVRFRDEFPPVSFDLNGDGTAETVAVLGCIQSFVGVPPASEVTLGVYDRANSLIAAVDAGAVRAEGLSVANGRVRLDEVLCEESVRACIPVGSRAVALEWGAAGPSLVELPANEFYSDRELTPGGQGFDVAALQVELVVRGATIETDGRFGPATEDAVRHAQSVNGLDVDGLAGARTRAALGIGRELQSFFRSEEELIAGVITYLNGQDAPGLPGDAIRVLERLQAGPSSSLEWSEFRRTSAPLGRVLVEVALRGTDGVADSMGDLQFCVTGGVAPRWCGLWYAPAPAPEPPPAEQPPPDVEVGTQAVTVDDSRALILEYYRLGSADDCNGAWALLFAEEQDDYSNGFDDFCSFWQRAGDSEVESCDPEGDAFHLSCIVTYVRLRNNSVARERVRFEIGVRQDSSLGIIDYQFLESL